MHIEMPLSGAEAGMDTSRLAESQLPEENRMEPVLHELLQSTPLERLTTANAFDFPEEPLKWDNAEFAPALPTGIQNAFTDAYGVVWMPMAMPCYDDNYHPWAP